MTGMMITFPLVVEKQVCGNCSMTLGIDKLSRNVVDINKDNYGIPAIIVRCPVCKALMEWETTCN